MVAFSWGQCGGQSAPNTGAVDKSAQTFKSVGGGKRKGGSLISFLGFGLLWRFPSWGEKVRNLRERERERERERDKRERERERESEREREGEATKTETEPEAKAERETKTET